MRVVTLASSSKGNCILVYTKDTKILVDIGIRLEELEHKLSILNINPHEITGILNTHEHIDHCRSIGAFMRKYDAPLYCHFDGNMGLVKKLGKINPNRIINFSDIPFEVGEFKIHAFKLPHDAASCVGFTIASGEKRISIATDLGHITPSIVDNMLSSRLVVLEANHDENMLLNNPNYSYILKNRILGKYGHLSNSLSARVIEKCALNGVKQIVLAHLSEENNTPEVCYNTICTYLESVGIIEGVNIKIDISPPSDIGPVFVLK